MQDPLRSLTPAAKLGVPSKSAPDRRLAAALSDASLLAIPGEVLRATPPASVDPMNGSADAEDGAKLVWRPALHEAAGALAPTRLLVEVFPARTGHSVAVEYVGADGSMRKAIAKPRSATQGARTFEADLSETPRALAPVLHYAGRPISPRLPLAPAAASRASSPFAAVPAYACELSYFGALSARAREQWVGPGPEGLRVHWAIEGRFVGPEIDAVVAPGACDFMRIRPDGIGVVDVRACLDCADGDRLFVAYNGALDLGPEGYARALQGVFPPMPPLVVAPRFETAAPRWLRLNRAQAVGVGEVDTRARAYRFDVYLVGVRASARGGPAS